MFRTEHVAIACLASLLAASPVRGQVDEEIRLQDRVTWKNPAGLVLTAIGTIIDEKEDSILIKTSLTEFPIKRSAIQGAIRRRNLPDAIYKALAKEAAGPGNDKERAARHLKIGLFCARPHPALEGEAPLPGKAFPHLYKAVQIDPRLVEAYPYLLDALARAREARGDERAKGVDLEEEADIFMLAKAGGFSHPEIDFRTAEILRFSVGRLDEAASIYEKLIVPAPGALRNRSIERRARRALAEIQAARGDMDGVLRIFAMDSNGNFEALYESACIRLNRGTPEDRVEARKLLEKAKEIQPDFPGIPRALAALDFLDGKTAQSRERLRRIVENGESDPGLLVDLAIVESASGMFAKAMKRLNGVIGDGGPPAAPAPAATAAPSAPGTDPAAPAGDAGNTPADPSTGTDAGSAAPKEEAVSVPLDPEMSRAYLARGQILEYRGNPGGALAEYRKAAAANPASGTAALFLASAIARSGDAARAREILAGIMKDHSDRKGLFAAYARVLADIEAADGQGKKALNLLEYAAGIEPGDPLLQRRLGLLLLDLGEKDRAQGHIEAAQKALPRDPTLVASLACLKYRSGAYEDAVRLFKSCIGIVPVAEPKEGKAAPPVPAIRRYADGGLAQAQDVLNLEVWTDDFNRPAGDEIARNWREAESFGVSIAVRDDHLLFSGQQANDPGGVTMIAREEPAENVERLSARLRFDAGSGRVRAGIRLESIDGRGGPPSAGLVFFRDYDGKLRFARKTTRSGWEDGVPTTEKEAVKGKPWFPGDAVWPAGNDFHALSIRRSGGSASAFDLAIDGTPVALNIPIEGLRGKLFSVGISGQTEAVGTAYKFEADDFRLFRLREVTKGEVKR
jgi:tetratricopeptide (TPR) repeat protein